MPLSRTVRLVTALLCAGALGACAAPGTPAESGAAPLDAPASAGPPSPEPEASSPPPSPAPIGVPAGVTAGVVVFDRQVGVVTAQTNPTMRFRSASLVKLLIVLDYLWERGPAYDVPAADRPRLDVMLRSSDDAAASYFWKRSGQRQIVSRMVSRLGLRDSAPPPAAQPGYWGYTALSAGDLVLVYRYLLERAPAPVRGYVLGNLRQFTTCGTDRYDQSFGIPSAFAKPWAVKQGWSGFGDTPARPCTAPTAKPARLTPGGATPGGATPGSATPGSATPGGATPARFAPAGPDMLGEVLHTTGVVGPDDRTIVVVLSVHRDGTSFAKAVTALNALTRTIPVPGSTPR